MYLFDTNIWLERLLDQDNSEVVGELLDKIPLEQIFEQLDHRQLRRRLRQYSARKNDTGGDIG